MMIHRNCPKGQIIFFAIFSHKNLFYYLLFVFPDREIKSANAHSIKLHFIDVVCDFLVVFRCFQSNGTIGSIGISIMLRLRYNRYWTSDIFYNNEYEQVLKKSPIFVINVFVKQLKHHLKPKIQTGKSRKTRKYMLRWILTDRCVVADEANKT